LNGRQRILAALGGEGSDRVPLTEIGIWPETLRRWRREGLPEGVSPHEFFGLDRIAFFSFEASLGLPERVLSEESGYRVYSDGDGCTYRMAVGQVSAPQFVGSSVACPADWRRLKANLRPDLARFDSFRKDIVFGEPLPESQPAAYARARREAVFTALVPLEPCWYYLRLLGEVEALANIALAPEFAAAVIADYNAFTLKMLKLIFARGYRFDALWVFSDLCYKNGMLFSPDFYEKSVLPHQRRLFDLARENGMKVIYHCDGNVAAFLPLVLRAGIDCIQPLEARAGNDAAGYLESYPGRLSCMGNIDMDAFTGSSAGTKEAIRREVSGKILAAKPSHRYLFHSDHSVPDSVSLENYGYAIRVAKEVAGYEHP
jgi:uroporphyrinogen decarboxylase